MKIFKHRSLMGLLYAVLLAIPLVSIISRVIYVQSNKNAYQSYYGDTINEKVINHVNYSDVQVNKEYTWITGGDNLYTNDYGTASYLVVNNVQEIVDFTDVDLSGTLRLRLYLTNENKTLFFLTGYGIELTRIHLTSTQIEFSFYLVGYSEGFNNNILQYFNYFNTVEYNKYSYLDNVFEYSVDSIIQENNFGKVDFLSWFANMFLDNNNQVNNRYLGFANWYMNYIMFVSCAYLLFLVLMWFINFARRLLDRGMNYDW